MEANYIQSITIQTIKSKLPNSVRTSVSDAMLRQIKNKLIEMDITDNVNNAKAHAEALLLKQKSMELEYLHTKYINNNERTITRFKSSYPARLLDAIKISYKELAQNGKLTYILYVLHVMRLHNISHICTPKHCVFQCISNLIVSSFTS